MSFLNYHLLCFWMNQWLAWILSFDSLLNNSVFAYEYAICFTPEWISVLKESVTIIIQYLLLKMCHLFHSWMNQCLEWISWDNHSVFAHEDVICFTPEWINVLNHSIEIIIQYLLIKMSFASLLNESVFWMNQLR